MMRERLGLERREPDGSGERGRPISIVQSRVGIGVKIRSIGCDPVPVQMKSDLICAIGF
jgi:hypothetical protein